MKFLEFHKSLTRTVEACSMADDDNKIGSIASDSYLNKKENEEKAQLDLEAASRTPLNKFAIFGLATVLCALILLVLVIVLWRQMRAREAQQEAGRQTAQTGQQVGSQVVPPHQQYASMDSKPPSSSQMPCLNCRLIQMGSAISYNDNRCPQCGNSCV